MSFVNVDNTHCQHYKDASPYHEKQKLSKLGKLFGLYDD